MKPTLFKKSALYIAMLAVAPMGYAADANEEGADDEVVQIIGSRSQKTRTVADTTVPVDIIGNDELTAMGSTADLTDNLKTLIPSYTATPATGDGSAFVRPTSLRGTAPDQTLILVDGKRRHRSALVQFFAPAAGNGAHGVDIGMIPSIAVKRVEVLRDGAAAQYGSDAIAGVINFVMKDGDDGGQVKLQYGQFDAEGESSTKFSFNKGVSVGDNGFINFSLEYTDNDALSRGIIRPDAQALLDAGVQGVGADSPFGDAPFTQTWGRPETSGLRVFINSGVDLGDNKKLYARLGYGDTDGRYRFFYRNPGHSTIASIVGQGYTGYLQDVGFTPFLDGAQTDLSFITGLEGELDNGTYYDLSVSYGTNELDYFLNNTLSSSVPYTSGEPKMDFDVGGYEQSEINLNADFSKLLTDNLNMAYGFEWREETYTTVAGEPDSYGASGMGGIKANDAGEFSRDNYAVYIDLEHDISYDFMLQYALRYEDFSDFGSTVNGKIAGRYSVTDETAIRGAVSTGFHAPTPGQANVQTIITTFDGATGLQVEEGLLPTTHPQVINAGGKPLTEETSFNISLGVTSDITSDTTLTVDFYQIAVDDRIYRTGDIQVPNIIDPTQTDTISFYTNAMNVEHSGMDLVLSTNIEWSLDTVTDISLAYSYNKIDVVDQQLVNGVAPVSDSLIEDIENNYPNSRFVLTTNTPIGDKMNFMLRANYYGEYYDERGTISADTQPSALIDPTLFLDAEFGYQLSPQVRLTFGVNNLTDQYPDEIGAENANRLSVGLTYPRRAAANYEGRSMYIGASYSFE